MIVCPNCSHKNPEDAQTCEACSKSLASFEYRVCSACGATNPAANAFCHRCLSALIPDAADVGEPEEEPQKPPPAETRPLPSEPSPKPWGRIDDELRWLVEDRQDTPPPEAAPSILPVEPEEPVQASEPPAAAPVRGEEAAPEGKGEPFPPIGLPEMPPIAGEQAAQLAAVEPEADLPPEERQPLLPEATVDTLADLDNLLPMEPVIATAHRVEATEQVGPNEVDRYDAGLFHQIATERAPLRESAQEVLPPRPPALPAVGRVLLNLMVLMAALVPFFTGGWITPWVQPQESVIALAGLIQELPADTTVLLSFDYDPAYAGEMDPLARAVIRHLAARSVRSVVMSTNPAGLGLATRIYTEVADESPAYAEYGVNYAILGYLPGLEAGLRTLNGTLANAFHTDAVSRAPLSELPATRGLATLHDVDHIILLSDSPQSVRRWIEQIRSRNGVSLHALVTARAEPILVPYQQSGQLQTLIGGFQAAEYELVAGVRPSALNLADAYAALFVVLVAIAIATNVAHVLGKRQRRKLAR